MARGPTALPLPRPGSAHRAATAVSTPADPAASQPSLTSARRGGPRPSDLAEAGAAGKGAGPQSARVRL